MVVDVTIDSLTDCIVDRESGKEFQTMYRKRTKKISQKNANTLKAQGWLFDWSIPQSEGYEVYELYTEHDNELQGMIAIKNNQEGLFSEISVVESAPHNRGSKGVYEGVGGNLFAIACKESFLCGFDGYVKFVAKTKLIEYYMENINAKVIGGQQMYLDEKAASVLVAKYFKGDKSMDDKVKENVFKYTSAVDRIMSFGDKFPDGRLVEPWDSSLPNYNPRLVDKEMKRLGRQLTEEELEKCIVSD